MTRQQSEGEVHVEAMRLILAEMERREDVPDWTIWQHMLNMLETIFQGIVDQRADDADEIDSLRKELANAQRELSEQSMVANVETQQDTAAWQQQVDSANAEVSYLRARLDEEWSVSAGLRQQLDAAQAAVTLQRAGIERLQAFVGKVRAILDREYDGREIEDIANAVANVDPGTEPTPVAEPLDAEGGA